MSIRIETQLYNGHSKRSLRHGRYSTFISILIIYDYNNNEQRQFQVENSTELLGRTQASYVRDCDVTLRPRLNDLRSKEQCCQDKNT